MTKSLQKFLYYEQKVNNHFQSPGIISKVPMAYRPESGRVFKLYYSLVPLEELTVQILENQKNRVEKEFYVEKQGKVYIKFFVHVMSEDLYEPLIKKYPFEGYYLATPTSSTRSLLVWDPKNERSKPFVVKLSLDCFQFGRNRAVEANMIDRAMAYSRQVSAIDFNDLKNNSMVLLKEVMGVYPKKELNQKAKISRVIDEEEKYSDQNGFIIRFIDEIIKESQDVYPFFSLFSVDQENDSKILFVEWWKKSGKEWDAFLKENILRPVVDAFSYLVFYQGLFFQAHAQNIIVHYDEKTNGIDKIYLRDYGSFGPVDIQVRIANGLSIAHLVTENTVQDFGFDVPHNPMTPFFSYLFSYVFYHDSVICDNKTFVKAIKGYSSLRVRYIFEELFNEALSKHYQISNFDQMTEESVKKAREAFLKSKDPKFKPDGKVACDFVERQKKKRQCIYLNNFTLDERFGTDDLAQTAYGIIFKENNKTYPCLALKSKGKGAK